MKLKAALAVSLCCSLLFTACAPGGTVPEASAPRKQSAAASQGAYAKITAEEAKDMIDTENVTIVDVRTAAEYAEAHIPGAVNLPVEEIGDRQPDALPDKEALLIVYCRTGVRSKQAADRLLALGYETIYDMGGIRDWPYDTEGGAPD